MFKTLRELTDRDARLVGGKATACARLLRAGFPVPDGVVVPADADEPAIDALGSHSWIRQSPEPAAFAVRSSGPDEDSAGHSFAGVHETMLNVRREGLAAAVRRCRASARSPQAHAYRQVRGIDDPMPEIGVLIQRMVSARAAGVAFTVNPATGADELVINSTFGLGDALVSGQVDPDEFIIDKRGSIRSRRLGTKAGARERTASLTTAQIEELGRLARQIESHGHAPQDIEWCHDGAQFWIVQARPITAVGLASVASAKVDPEWTRANLAEVLPDQMSPQALDVFGRALDGAQRRFLGRLLAPVNELGPMTKVFYGRMYMNLSQLRRVTAIAGAPAADLLRSLGHSEEVATEDERPLHPSALVRMRALPDLIRVGLADARVGHLMREHEARIANALSRLAVIDPRALPDREIARELDRWTDAIEDHLQVVFVLAGTQLREGALRKICRRVAFPYDRLVYPVLAAGARSVSTQQAVDLVGLARLARDDPRAACYLKADDGQFSQYRDALKGTPFLEAFDRFLAKYGHRGRYESDWSLPRYSEAPAPLLFAVRGHLDGATLEDPEAVSCRLRAAADAAWREFEGRLSWWQRSSVLPVARALLRQLKQRYVWREQVRSDLTRVLARVRPWHLTLADRFAERGWLDRREDYFLLTVQDVGEAVHGHRGGAQLRGIVRQRAEQLARERPLRMPLLMRESTLHALLASEPASGMEDGRRLPGFCVSPGSAEGQAVVMRDPGEFALMKRGAILVAPAVDPSWTPLFTLAAGVVVEVGGMLSHASTIAREYGLPALANVKDATMLLRTGDLVRLNASAGYVERTREASDTE